MRVAVDHGAAMINDIFALRAPGAVQAMTGSSCAICLMHMQGEPLTMQKAPAYRAVVDEVSCFLRERVDVALNAGIARERLLVDPGFGFGKSLEHNRELFQRLSELAIDGLPLLVGVSRKSMLGAITGRDIEGRLPASVAAALLAAQRGAGIVRVHDVAATRDALAAARRRARHAPTGRCPTAPGWAA
jgi:dihydropteroate synthase